MISTVLYYLISYALISIAAYGCMGLTIVLILGLRELYHLARYGGRDDY